RQAIDYLKKHGIPLPATSRNDPEPEHSGCPGMKSVDLRDRKPVSDNPAAESASELSQWPVQLKLVNPQAACFQDADLVIAADCVPFAYAEFHQRFLAGKVLVVFCPKLDNAYEEYVEKMARIIQSNTIKSISVVHMEVPCCFGTMNIVNAALKKAGKDIVIQDHTISLKGEIIPEKAERKE
ncbi:MAG: 4Fe-4S ferredoxin, partial [Candidatus Omnitrophica bacterium]|nr:4Fe-4S ferredoxin [Candidatus Omnitrophota bacterium]